MVDYDMGICILNALKAMGKNQKELAEETGLTEASLSRYIVGSRSPRADNIVRIAKALHVTTDYLLGTDEPKRFDEELKSVAAWIARNAKELTAAQKVELAAAIFWQAK